VEQSVNKFPVIYFFICLIAGAALPLAFAPFNYAVIGIISPAVLFFFWFKSSSKSAFILGYAYGLGMFGTGVNWLHISINLFGGVNLAGALIATYALVAFLALYPAVVGWAGRKYYFQDSVWLLLLLPALWTLAEWCRSWILTGFPWLNLGYSQTDTFLAGFSPVFGVYGISWLVCLNAALLVYFFYATRSGKLVAVTGLIFIWGLSIPVNSIHWTTQDTEEKSVVIVQAAIPQELKWQPEIQQRTIDMYLALSDPYWGVVDLIVWPETAIPMFYHQANELIKELRRLANYHHTDFFSGVPFMDLQTRKYYNSIIVIGRNDGIYLKRHLVPFGEYLPVDKWLRPIINILHIPMSAFSPGTGRPLLEVAGVYAGVSVCYEDVFGEEIIDAMPEAKFHINVSNDAWFGDSLAPHQHLQMARMRALETGRYLVRSTNTGISAIIDERGNIISRSPQFEQDALSGTIKTFSGSTPYSLYGNWLVILLSIVVTLLCFILNIKNL
jgi:apolipoprotein N-acyltransferase